MNNCNSITQEGQRCRNRKLPTSRYCWRHQDIQWLIGTLVGGILTIAVALGALFYQERTPSLQTNFTLGERGDPSVLLCSISNSGRGEATDVFLSFNNMLPLDTKVLGSPELGLSVVEAEAPPDPEAHPTEAKFQKAFAVRIPRIAAKDTIQFRLITANADNERAAKQSITIRQDQFRVLLAFIDGVSKVHPDEVKNWRKDEVLNAHIKNDCFFTPSYLSYENGRTPVSLLTDSEQIAGAVNQDLYAKYKKEFIEIFQGGPEFKAPVVRIKTSEGESTTALFPAYVRSYIESSVAAEDLKKTSSMKIPIPVPKQY